MENKAMKKVLIVAHFCSDFNNTGNNRFNYLAGQLSEICEVELVTTDFSHKKKDYRDKEPIDCNYKVTMLHENVYKKNVSVKRIIAHRGFGKNLKTYLENMKIKPDVIYCAVPSLDAANAASDFAKKNGIKFIIDVQDLWPEAFQMVLNIPLIFYPMKKKADKIYESADEALAVSKTYCDRVRKVNKNISDAYPVYLGTNLKQFDQNVSDNTVINEGGELWIGYCGTLGNSYDLTCAIDAIKLLNEQGYENIKFWVMGEGPLRQKFEAYAIEKDINAVFTGYIPYAEMCGLLCACDIALNPIVAGSAGSIINKHADYAAAGIPVVNSQENEEYRALVDEYEMGFNCNNGDAIDMSNKIRQLLDNQALRESMGVNARRCAEEKFDRAYTYQQIIDLICKK